MRFHFPLVALTLTALFTSTSAHAMGDSGSMSDFYTDDVVDYTGEDFSGLDLSGQDFTNDIFTDTNLEGTVLTDANLIGSVMFDVNLTEAIFEGTTLNNLVNDLCNNSTFYTVLDFDTYDYCSADFDRNWFGL